MISARKLSELLAALHSVSLEKDHWPAFLSALCEQLQALQCFYITAGSRHPLGVRAQGGLPFDTEGQRRYNEYYYQSDPYSIAFPLRPRIGPIIAEELVDRRELERTEFYQYHAIANGMHHALFLPAVLAPDRLELITIWRTMQQAPFDADCVELLDLLLPHVQSALQTQQVLAASAARATRAEGALDAVAAAAFILCSQGRIVHHNSAAEALLKLQDGVVVREQRLGVADARTQGKLQALIGGAAAAGAAMPAQPGGVIALPRPSGKRSLQVMVLPLRLPGAACPAHVLVLIGDPDRAAQSSETMLSALYGLTRAEVQICNELLSGRTVEQIAARRCVSPGTLRIQVKSVFQKTATRRQSDLMKLLLSLPGHAPDGI